MCHCGEHTCSSDGHGNDATQQGRRCRSDRRRSACRRRRRGRGRGSACARWRPPPDHQQRMAPAWRPRGRCHVERDRTALVAASGPRGGEPESISVHRRRGVGGRDIGRSGSPTPMIRPATAGVRSYRAGIRRGAVSVEMGRSRTSCSSTWARSPPASRPSWPRSASLPAALIRRRSTKPASTAALDRPGGSGVRGIGLNRTGFCGGSSVPRVSRGQLA